MSKSRDETDSRPQYGPHRPEPAAHRAPGHEQPGHERPDDHGRPGRERPGRERQAGRPRRRGGATGRTSGGLLRIRALDGLRGTAALVVVLHHLSMTLPGVSAGYDDASTVRPFSLAWWLVASPVKIVVAGPEFVLVFFALSGFVLTLAPIAARDGAAKPGYDWIAYYVRRILRIGVPAAASMVIAYLVITLLPHPRGRTVSSWVARQADPDVSWHALLTQTLLIVNKNRPGVNPPMWSLTWEMWFSLLLPLAVVFVLWWRRRPTLWLMVLLAVSLDGYLTHHDGATFLPAFALGALLGAQAPRIQAFVARHHGERRLTVLGGALAAAAPLVMIAYWLLRTPLGAGPEGSAALLAMRVPGALLIVAVVAFWPPARALFEKRLLVWLGTISFSLYLVHSQVLVAMGLNFTGPLWPLGAAAALLLIAGLTFVLYRFVEKPSIGFAKKAGQAVSHGLRSAGERVAATGRGLRHTPAAGRRGGRLRPTPQVRPGAPRHTRPGQLARRAASRRR